MVICHPAASYARGRPAAHGPSRAPSISAGHGNKGAAALAAAVAGLALALPAAAQDAGKIKHGEQVFQYWCATCHGKGAGKGGTAALAFKYKGDKPALLEERTDLTPDQVKYFVRNGVSIMPFFRRTEVSDADLDAIGAYLSRAKDKGSP